MDDIRISILIPSREREELLKKNILRSVWKAKSPQHIEWLIRADDDDENTINMLTSTPELKNINIRVFVGKRVGFSNISMMAYYLCSKAKGNIIVPFADDCEILREAWDDVLWCCRNVRGVIGGGKGILAFTSKKLFEELWPTEPNRADITAERVATKMGIFVNIGPWAKIHKMSFTAEEKGRFMHVPTSSDDIKEIII